MAPEKRQQILDNTSIVRKSFEFLRKYFTFSFIKSLLFDPAFLPIVSIGILLAELLLNILVINKVRYTEIDWQAYMQEVEGFLNGTTNYALLKGDTGPLVYPAGFVYFYSALYFLTNRGQNILVAQYIFVGFYLIHIALVLRLYSKSRKIAPYVLIISIFSSYRIHSIYVLRLFNDPIAIIFVYAALNLFMDDHWTFGSICFSLGVSIKMNVLLFAPAIFLLYITNLGHLKTVKQLCVCAFVQLALGAPFLLTHPIEYIRGSFDFGRVFEHKWTVNYRFLDRAIFESRILHLSLLLLHIGFLIVFALPFFKYFQSYYRLRQIQQQFQPQIDAKNRELKESAKKKSKRSSNIDKLSKEQEQFLQSFENSLKSTMISQRNESIKVQSEEKTTSELEQYSVHFDQATQLALLPIFFCNFIGIICARSLHYQFYVWYFHSLPYLAWSTNFNTNIRFLILLSIELCWNTYPSTIYSSLLLHACHIVLLFGVGTSMISTLKTAQKKAV